MSVSSKWKEIWNGKPVVSKDGSADEFTRYTELKAANGFDVAVGNAEAYYRGFYNEWLSFYEKCMEICGGSADGVFEVGTGSGVNLYMFGNRLKDNKRWGGVDYSQSMIESAKISTGSDDFICCGADELKTEPKYDIVMSESVFQYFPSLEYAETVFRKMIEKSGKLTYLGELHNKEYEEELMEYRRRTIEDYEKKYEGLGKLFVTKDWVREIAESCGKRVEFTAVDNPEYLNGKYEFNAYVF